jgi:hypothetical protein
MRDGFAPRRIIGGHPFAGIGNKSAAKGLLNVPLSGQSSIALGVGNQASGLLAQADDVIE